MTNKLKTLGYVMLYAAIMDIVCYVVISLWVNTKLLSEDFKFKEFNYGYFIAFTIILLLYRLIFKFRKKDYFKALNLSKIKLKNVIQLTMVGVMMGVFTSTFMNTSFIVKTYPHFQGMVVGQVYGNRIFIVAAVIVALTIVFEEMIFRGIIFSELRSGFSDYKSVIISAAVYGLTNGLLLGYAVGIYAFISAVLYALACVYMNSNLSSIIFQLASTGMLFISVKSELFFHLKDFGDPALIVAVVISMSTIIVLFTFLYKDYKKNILAKSNSGKSNSILA